jgi:DNA polymerase-3 subunit chi
MTDQVDFYILENAGGEEKRNYACRIAHKAYSQKLKVFIKTGSSQSEQELDKLLWSYSQESFIPHCVVNGGEAAWDDYPIQLGMDSNLVNNADILLNLSQDVVDDYDRFPRIAELVCGEELDRKSGRERFRHYREKGIQPNTHKLG